MSYLKRYSPILLKKIKKENKFNLFAFFSSSTPRYDEKREILQEEEEKEIQFLSQFKGGSVDLVKNNETGLAILTLNNPERKNALTGSMMLDLREITNELLEWTEGSGLILKGKNNFFCSGVDLSLIKSMYKTKDKNQPYIMSSFLQRVLTQFYNLPLVTVAMVEGSALGGGAELSTCCDFRVMTSEASLGFVQIHMGLSPAFGGSFRLVDLVGRHQALKIFSSGKVLKGKEALESGLVDFILTGNKEPLEETKDWLGTFTHSSPEVVRAAKKIVTSGFCKNHFNRVNNFERLIFINLFGNESNIKALKKNKKF